MQPIVFVSLLLLDASVFVLVLVLVARVVLFVPILILMRRWISHFDLLKFCLYVLIDCMQLAQNAVHGGKALLDTVCRLWPSCPEIYICHSLAIHFSSIFLSSHGGIYWVFRWLMQQSNGFHSYSRACSHLSPIYESKRTHLGTCLGIDTTTQHGPRTSTRRKAIRYHRANLALENN